MNLTLSEEQTLIRENANKFLASHYAFEKRQEIINEKPSFYFKHWKEFAELGWLGIAFPEKLGGYGGNVSNLMTLMECLGANLVLEPFVFNNLIIGKIFEHFPELGKSSLALLI